MVEPTASAAELPRGRTPPLAPDEADKLFRRGVSLFNEVVEPLNRDLAQFERLKKIALLPAEFSVASGELTPTLKLRRRVVLDRWQHVVDRMYDDV